MQAIHTITYQSESLGFRSKVMEPGRIGTEHAQKIVQAFEVCRESSLRIAEKGIHSSLNVGIADEITITAKVARTL
jgi:hypothetical protein